jgi:hypothetical protein
MQKNTLGCALVPAEAAAAAAAEIAIAAKVAVVAKAPVVAEVALEEGGGRGEEEAAVEAVQPRRWRQTWRQRQSRRAKIAVPA